MPTTMPRIPTVEPQDIESVRSNLLAAARSWSRGERREAALAVHRAAEAAFAADHDKRGLVLAREAAQLRSLATRKADVEPPQPSTKKTSKPPPRASVRPARTSGLSERPAKRPSIKPAAKTAVKVVSPPGTTSIDVVWDDEAEGVVNSPVVNSPVVNSSVANSPRQGPAKGRIKPPPLPEVVVEVPSASKKVMEVDPAWLESPEGRLEVTNSHRPPISLSSAARSRPGEAVGEAIRVWVGPLGQVELFTATDRTPAGFVEAILVSPSATANLADRLRRR